MQFDKILAELFVNWTKLKIRIHTEDVVRFPQEREIWWASLGQNIGVEINGKNEKFERPVLVVKKYNRHSLLVLPVSSKPKEGPFYFNFVDSEGRKNVAVLPQLKSISVKRFIRKMGKIEPELFEEIKNKVRGFV